MLQKQIYAIYGVNKQIVLAILAEQVNDGASERAN